LGSAKHAQFFTNAENHLIFAQADSTMEAQNHAAGPGIGRFKSASELAFLQLRKTFL
jgi:hypothetical protein